MKRRAIATLLVLMLLIVLVPTEVLAASNNKIVRPAPVTGFKAMSSYNTINLKWNKVPGVDGYIIRYTRKGIPGRTWIMDPNKTSYTYKVGKDTRYYFSIVSLKNNRISAIDAKANSEAVRTLYYRFTFRTTRTLTSHTGGRVKETFKAGTTKIAKGFSDGKYIFDHNGRTYYVMRISTKNRQIANLGNKKTYTSEEAESFVNRRGLSSRTKHLIWANLHTQKIYIFKGSKGKWKCVNGPWLVATGKASTPTSSGLTRIKQKVRSNGAPYWNVCSVFSIHGNARVWGSLGYPKSGACIRNTNEHARWIYNNCPIGTAVFVF